MLKCFYRKRVANLLILFGNCKFGFTDFFIGPQIFSDFLVAMIIVFYKYLWFEIYWKLYKIFICENLWESVDPYRKSVDSVGIPQL